MSLLSDKNRQRTERRILESIRIRCKKCNGVMIRVYDIWDQGSIGYSCKSCDHYYLFG